MESFVFKAINKYSLLSCEEREVTVALSGGADSMALLNVLVNLREKLGINLTAAHLNHLIRGEEALRDEEFVKKQCEKLKIPLFCERADIPEFAKQNGLSIELAARKVRYDFLNQVSPGLIATAHTASDNLETVLLNITRGTALNGLCGIPAKRGKIIRPLILCTRSQIEDYCRQNSISYVTDSTNLSDNYTRNKIRHNAVSVLKEINPSVENAVLRMCDSLREDADLLDGMAEDYIVKNTDNDGNLMLTDFCNISFGIGKRVLKKFIEGECSEITLENTHIKSVFSIALNGGKTSLPGNCTAVSDKKVLKVYNNRQKNADITEFEVSLSECENNFFEKNKNVNNLFLNNSLDCDKIIGKLVIRTRIAGDSIRLKNRGCTKTLNRLFSENRISLDLRDKIPVIADEKGIVWVYGFGVSSRCAVTNKTEKMMLIKTECKNSMSGS